MGVAGIERSIDDARGVSAAGIGRTGFALTPATPTPARASPETALPARGREALHHLQPDLAEALDRAELVAALDRADALGRAGEDQVAGLQLPGRQIGDLSATVQISSASRPSAGLAVDLSQIAPFVGWPISAAGMDRADRRRLVEALAELPRPAQLLRLAPAGRAASCRGRRHSRRRGRAPLDRDVARRPCRARRPARSRMVVLGQRRVGVPMVVPSGTSTMASAGFMKKNGGSRPDRGPSRAHARRSCGRRSRCGAPGRCRTARDRDGGTLRFGDDGGHGFP